jgi:hypothetical protein
MDFGFQKNKMDFKIFFLTDLYMPKLFCKDCDYSTMDKCKMERHHNRKYPCNTIGIVHKESPIVIKKLDQVKEEDLINDIVKKVDYKIDGKTDKLKKI